MKTEIQEQIKLATEKLKKLPDVKQAAIWQNINCDKDAHCFGIHSYSFNFDQNAEIGDTRRDGFIMSACIYIVKNPFHESNMFEKHLVKKVIEAHTEKAINKLVKSIFKAINNKATDFKGWSIWKVIKDTGAETYTMHQLTADIGNVNYIDDDITEICIFSIPNFYYNQKP